MVAEAVTEPDSERVIPPLHTIEVDSVVQVRDIAKRELDVRLMPWGRVISTVSGLETFTRGAFLDTDPASVRLMGLEHEAHLSIGQDGRPILRRHPVGKGVSLDEREDAAYMTFRVAQTARGDEVLALAVEGIASGVSIEFTETPNGSPVETRSGRRVKNHKRVRLHGAATTFDPAYEEAVVLAVRTDKETPVPEATPATEPQAPPAIDPTTFNAAFGQLGDRIETAISAVQTRSAVPDEVMDKFLARLESLEEKARASFQIPAHTDEKPYPDDFGRGDWLKLVLRSLSGETVSHTEMQARLTADLVTADNLGVVPPTYTQEMIGIIDPSRPFLTSTRRLPTPRTGMSLVAPKLVTRPTVGTQTNEKDELASTTTSITTETFNAITVGGYGDISLQLLRRSDPSYLELYMDLLSEAYAIDADDKAVDDLLNEGTVNDGGTLDPESGAQFGAAWQNAAAVSRRLVPDTLWLSSAAVAAFIDAKSDTTNMPLYANMAANFTAGGGPGGSVSGLRPVHVPALDDEAVDIIVGPARGFAWAEDGTYTLQVEVPAKAGRDVGIVGMLWFAPLYPAAFTTYALIS